MSEFRNKIKWYTERKNALAIPARRALPKSEFSFAVQDILGQRLPGLNSVKAAEVWAAAYHPVLFVKRKA